MRDPGCRHPGLVERGLRGLTGQLRRVADVFGVAQSGAGRAEHPVRVDEDALRAALAELGEHRVAPLDLRGVERGADQTLREAVGARLRGEEVADAVLRDRRRRCRGADRQDACGHASR